MLHDKGQPALVQEVIARRIIEIAKAGERDPNRICERVLADLGLQRDQRQCFGGGPCPRSHSARGFCLRRSVAHQPVAVRFDRLVALAGRFPEPFQIGDLDASAAVADQAGVPAACWPPARRWSAARRASAPGIPGSVPTCRCRSASRVRNSQRDRRASTLCDALQAADCCAWANSACSCRISVVRKATLWSATVAQRFDVKDRSDPFDLDDAPVQRHPAVQRGRAADEAVAADHRGLDQLSVRQTDHQRDDAAVREVDPVDASRRRRTAGLHAPVRTA